MNTDDNIAVLAMILGTVEMMYYARDLFNTKTMRAYSLEQVLIGILASTLWIVYQYRKGANVSATYSVIGLLLSLYVLKRLLKERKDDKKND